MKKIAAFFSALAIVLVLAVGVHFLSAATMEQDHAGIFGWTDEVKYTSMHALAANFDENTIPVMGSSELQHQKSTPYNPANLLAGQDTRLMLIGAGYYQSLYHATALAAMEPEMENRRAVLILAPQWFRKTGVREEAFASRFSEENYIDMLQNEKLSADTRAYLIKRTHKLLSNMDPQTESRLSEYEDQYLNEDLSPRKSSPGLHEQFLREKNRTNICLRFLAYDLLHSRKYESGSGEPDFESLRAQAAVDGEEACGGNEFFVSGSYYRNYIVKVMDDVKDEGISTGYSVSPEFKDLEYFLRTCREVGVKPLLVISPVNGYWYDYIGFNREAREDYYGKIRELAAEYGAETADFSDREYEEYFMEDTVHIGWKGWVDVCEAIYRFAEKA